MRKVAIFAALTVLAGSAPAVAATLSTVQGAVSVSSGGGFQRVASGTQVQPGDRVNVSQGGSARISYDNGCTLVLDQPGLYHVPGDPTCTQPGTFPSTTQLAVGAAVAVGVGVAIYLATKDSSP